MQITALQNSILNVLNFTTNGISVLMCIDTTHMLVESDCKCPEHSGYANDTCIPDDGLYFDTDKSCVEY
ncbi:unnamed protein product [Blepharisma stoltei]|uniref:Uncharacterized protein n=1 Tax=Blepharisma stoltei TaxID=1481888 RepID=A0AAU9K9G9_9CILI|nr:unnamed protein product [Blepharisma stoltei]